MRVRITKNVHPICWYLSENTQEIYQVCINRRLKSGNYQGYIFLGSMRETITFSNSDIFETKQEAKNKLKENLNGHIEIFKRYIKENNQSIKQEKSELKYSIKDHERTQKNLKKDIKELQNKIKQLDKPSKLIQ